MELNTKYEISPSMRTISSSGVVKIDYYLNSQQLPYPIGLSMSTWLEEGGEFRGKLPNRLGGYYKKIHDIKLTSAQRAAVGNIAKKHMFLDSTYLFDFTDKFDWSPGDFGDRGSCFWDENELARSVLEEEGALAIRFYDEDYGIARAWLYQLDEDTWILFNAYSMYIETIASVLTKYLTRNTDETWCYGDLDNLTVSGRSWGLVYINANPQIVFVDGSEPPCKVDLDWPWYIICGDCGGWLLEEDTCYINDERLCDTCALQYIECYRCGEAFFRGGMYSLEEESYCPDCYVEREAEIEEDLRTSRCDYAECILSDSQLLMT